MDLLVGAVQFGAFVSYTELWVCRQNAGALENTRQSIRVRRVKRSFHHRKKKKSTAHRLLVFIKSQIQRPDKDFESICVGLFCRSSPLCRLHPPQAAYKQQDFLTKFFFFFFSLEHIQPVVTPVLFLLPPPLLLPPVSISSRLPHTPLAAAASRPPDPLHAYLGLCGLSLIGEPSLRKVHPALNITQRAFQHLQQLQQTWKDRTDSCGRRQ